MPCDMECESSSTCIIVLLCMAGTMTLLGELQHSLILCLWLTTTVTATSLGEFDSFSGENGNH